MLARSPREGDMLMPISSTSLWSILNNTGNNETTILDFFSIYECAYVTHMATVRIFINMHDTFGDFAIVGNAAELIDGKYAKGICNSWNRLSYYHQHKVCAMMKVFIWVKKKRAVYIYI